MNTTRVVRRLTEVIKRINGEYLLCSDSAARDPSLGAHISRRDGIQQCDMVITVGGDGTLLSAGYLASEYDRPVLGINTGHLGFLTAMEGSEVDSLEQILSRGLTEEKKHFFLCCEINGKDVRYCLNDVTVSRNMYSNSVDLDIFSNGESIMRFSGDGVIISTSTGSTAYSLSAGGPIVDVDLEALILSPVAPHTLTRTSMVLSRDKVLTMKASVKGENRPLVSFDGNEHIFLSEDDRIKVFLSDKYVRILGVAGYGQFQKVDRKLKTR